MRPVSARVRPPRGVPQTPGTGAEPGTIAQPGLGLWLRPRIERGGCLRALPEAEDRQATPRHRARDGLPPHREPRRLVAVVAAAIAAVMTTAVMATTVLATAVVAAAPAVTVATAV